MSKPIKKQQSMFEKVRKLNHIPRCSLFPTVNSTSVAEHSFQVAAMAHLFAHQLRYLGCPINVEEVTTLALFHDVEESSVSDIPWHIKHHLRKHSEFDQIVDKYVAKDLEQYSEYLAFISTQSCDGTLEWLVVKICDISELLLYCQEEYDMGNRHMWEMICNSGQELQRLLTKLRVSLDSNLAAQVFGCSDILKELNRLLHWVSDFEA